MIRIRDLREAEKAVDTAVEALRSYLRNPDEWSGYQTIDTETHMRTLILHAAHFERIEQLQRNVEHAQTRLRGLQQSFAPPPG